MRQTTKKNNNGKRYTEQQKIATVGILLANSKGNGGMSIHAIQLAREYLQSNVSTETLSVWIKNYRDKVQQAILEPEQDKVTAEIVFTATNNSVEVMESIRDQLLAMVARELRDNPNEVKKQGLQRLVTSAAILQDKIKDAIAASAQMQAAIRPLAILCSERGIDIYALIEDMTTTVQQLSQEQIDTYKNRGRLNANN